MFSFLRTDVVFFPPFSPTSSYLISPPLLRFHILRQDLFVLHDQILNLVPSLRFIQPLFSLKYSLPVLMAYLRLYPLMYSFSSPG